MDCRILAMIGVLTLGGLAIFVGWCIYKVAGAVRWVHKHYKKGGIIKHWIDPSNTCKCTCGWTIRRLEEQLGTHGEIAKRLEDRIFALEAAPKAKRK